MARRQRTHTAKGRAAGEGAPEARQSASPHLHTPATPGAPSATTLWATSQFRFSLGLRFLLSK